MRKAKIQCKMCEGARTIECPECDGKGYLEINTVNTLGDWINTRVLARVIIDELEEIQLRKEDMLFKAKKIYLKFLEEYPNLIKSIIKHRYS